MRRHLLAFALFATATAACGGSDIGSGTEYATDTWAKPTHHGDLTLESPNYAKFTDSERFHGWSFEVTGDDGDSVEFVLETDAMTANLNTVMYLYTADEEGKKLGAYIAKNDNASEETMDSRIAKTLAPGHYFVQVKTSDVLERGDFALLASCTGAGCPHQEAPGNEVYCESAEESFGKCMDDSLDATEEECAPKGADAMICCNTTDEWYCADVCDPQNFHIAKLWNENLDALWGVFPEDDFTGLVDYHVFASPSCSSPSLDAVGEEIMDGANALLDDHSVDTDEDWTIDGWVMRSDADYHSFTVNEDVVTVVDANVGEEATARFSAWIEVPCPNCTDGFARDALYYPNIGKVVVLDSRWGGDS